MKTKPAKPVSDDVRREIEVRAYLIWESEGCPQGREHEHWMRAEAAVLAEIASKKPAKKAAAAKTNGVAKAVVAEKAKRPAKKAAKPAHREG